MFDDVGIGRQLGRPVPQFPDVAPAERPPQRHHQRRRHIEVVGGPRCAPRRSEVADLGEQAGGRGRLVVGPRCGLDPADESDGPAQQTLRGGVELAGGGEPVEAVGAQRIEHAVAGHVGEGGDDHRGVHEVGERSGRVGGGRHLACDVLGGGQVETVREHGQGTEQAPLVLGEQVIGPSDGSPQRAVMLAAR
jgi:hypothetical protein